MNKLIIGIVMISPSTSHLFLDLARTSPTSFDPHALLAAVSSLITTTPDQNRQELRRLIALANAMLSYANEKELLHLSRSIAHKTSINKSFVLNLVQMKGAIAAPLLSCSKLLSQDDLIALSRSTDHEGLLALSTRGDLPEEALLTMIKRGSSRVSLALSTNKLLEISPRVQEMLWQRGMQRHNSGVKSVLMAHKDFNSIIAAGSFFSLSSSERRHLIQAFHQKPLSDMSLALPKNSLCNSQDDRELVRLIDGKEWHELITYFAGILSVSSEFATQLVNDPSCELLALACRALHIRRSTFARLVVRLQDIDNQHIDKINDLAEYYYSLDPEISYILLKVIQNGEPPLTQATQPSIKRRTEVLTAKRYAHRPSQSSALANTDISSQKELHYSAYK